MEDNSDGDVIVWHRRTVGVEKPEHAPNLDARELGDLMFARPADHQVGSPGKAMAATTR